MQQTFRCPNCGAPVAYGAKFCGNCGTPLNWQPTQPQMQPPPVYQQQQQWGITIERISPKSRLAATLLAWFLGEFGAHRFYLGKIGTAVIMLILGILGWATVWIWGIGLIFLIPVAIWALIDFIFAVSGSMKDKDGMPIKNW